MRAHPRRRNGQGIVPRRAALLHRRAGTGDEGDFPGAFDFVHGHPDLQEIAGLARPRRRASGRSHHGRDRRAVSGARQIPRQAQRAVLRRRNRQECWRRPAAFRSRRFRARPRRISSACSPRCRRRKLRHDADADDSRLRILGRRSSSRARLGRLRSQKSEKPPPPLLAAGRADVPSRRDADRDRHLARSARAVDRRQCRSSRRGVPDP